MWCKILILFTSASLYVARAIKCSLTDIFFISFQFFSILSFFFQKFFSNNKMMKKISSSAIYIFVCCKYYQVFNKRCFYFLYISSPYSHSFCKILSRITKWWIILVLFTSTSLYITKPLSVHWEIIPCRFCLFFSTVYVLQNFLRQVILWWKTSDLFTRLSLYIVRSVKFSWDISVGHISSFTFIWNVNVWKRILVLFFQFFAEIVSSNDMDWFNNVNFDNRLALSGSLLVD